MKKYPFIKQQNSKTCAVASLQMIIKYYKGYISANYLEELTNTTKNGTTAFHLIEAAKQIGFECKGLKLELKDLKSIQLPCIVHVTLNNSFNHYMVLYEINKNNLVIADPGKNISKWSFSDFEKIWNNVVITFRPVKQIPILQNEIKYGIFIKETCLKLVKPLSKTYLLCVITIILAILSSFSFTVLLDLAIEQQLKKIIVTTFIFFLIIGLYKNLFEFVRNKFLIVISHKLDWLLTNDIFQKIISLPYRYYRNHTTGDLVSRINDLKIVKNVSSNVLLLIMVDIPLMFISAIILFIINHSLFYYSVIMILLISISNLLFNNLYKKNIPLFYEKNSLVNNNMIEKISGFETIKGLGIENEMLNDFKQKYSNLQETSFNIQKISNIHSILKSLISEIGTLVIFFLGSLSVLDNNISIGSLIAFNTLFVYFLNPIKNINDMLLEMKEAKNALNRIINIIIEDKEDGTITKNMLGNIEYKNLNFSHDLINPTLENINFKIKAGEKVLLLGESGTGKSTIVKLLTKAYKAPKNSVFIDGVDINNYTLKTLRDNICYISQNEILFTDSLLNNLKLNRDIEIGEIEKILDFCYIRNIFKHSNLGIILGRSLLKRFNILIIDEGLNQVDISLERKLLKKIINKYKNKTIICISHRLENIDLFNHVISITNHNVGEDLVKNAA